VKRQQAGAFAGISVNLLVFPFDTLKTRLQSPAFQQTRRSATSILDRALWRKAYQGVGTVLLVAVPSSGVFFTTYEGMKYVLGGSSSTEARGFLPQPAVHALSSSIAQLINCVIVTPAEVLKQNAQMLDVHHAAPGPPSPTMKVLQQLKRHPTKLWRGYTALAARDLPFTALQFPVFEHLREVLIAQRSRLKKGDGTVNGVLERAWIAALSASVAGGAAAWVTTPFDVVKTRMMLEAGTQNTSQAEYASRTGLMVDDCRRGGQAGRRSGVQIGKEMLQHEGIRGLFRGGFIRAAFTIVGNGLFMGIYECAKLYLQER